MEELKKKIEEKHIIINSIKAEVSKVLVGQKNLLKDCLWGFLRKDIF